MGIGGTDQRFAVPGRQAELPRLRPDRAGTTAEALGKAAGTPTLHPKLDETADIAKRPGVASTRLPVRPIVRRGQPQRHDQIEERHSRDGQVETERVEAMAARNHAGQHAGQEDADGGDGNGRLVGRRGGSGSPTGLTILPPLPCQTEHPGLASRST